MYPAIYQPKELPFGFVSTGRANNVFTLKVRQIFDTYFWTPSNIPNLLDINWCMRSLVPEAGISGRYKWLHPQFNVGINYLSLPEIHVSGAKVLICYFHNITALTLNRSNTAMLRSSEWCGRERYVFSTNSVMITTRLPPIATETVKFINKSHHGAMGLFPDTWNCGLRMHRGCRERPPPPSKT